MAKLGAAEPSQRRGGVPRFPHRRHSCRREQPDRQPRAVGEVWCLQDSLGLLCLPETSSYLDSCSRFCQLGRGGGVVDPSQAQEGGQG